MTDSNPTPIEVVPDTTTTEAPNQAPEPQEGTGDNTETFDLEAARKLRRENQSLRTRMKAAEEAAETAKKAAEREKMDENERLAAELADMRAALEAANTERSRATMRADLAPFVLDAEAAIKLVDPETHLLEDGRVNTDAFLESFPFMRKDTQGAPERARVPAANAARPSGDSGPLSQTEYAQQAKEKGMKWATENYHRVSSGRAERWARRLKT